MVRVAEVSGGTVAENVVHEPFANRIRALRPASLRPIRGRMRSMSLWTDECTVGDRAWEWGAGNPSSIPVLLFCHEEAFGNIYGVGFSGNVLPKLAAIELASRTEGIPLHFLSGGAFGMLDEE